MIYAIGDIHGQKEMLDHALALITEDGGEDAQIVFLGDYTDRGPDSRGVIDALIEGRDAGRNWHFILGNHDHLFADYIQTGNEHDPWVASGISWLNPRLGGTITLASYGVVGTAHFEEHTRGELEIFTSFETDAGSLTSAELQAAARAAVPQSHMDFLTTLPLTFETDDLLFVHAGIRPGVPLADQKRDELIWIREGFLDDDTDHGKMIVHGHTALETPTHFGNRIDLDAGAGYGRPLIPAAFDGRDCYLLTQAGRVPLKP